VRTPAAGGPTMYSVAWSPDGSRIASGDAHGLVHIWQMPAARS